MARLILAICGVVLLLDGWLLALAFCWFEDELSHNLPSHYGWNRQRPTWPRES